MVDLATIAAITTNLGSLTQISRELMSLVGDKAASVKIIELNAKIIEAQGFVMAAQSQHSAMADRLSELEQELKDLKDFRSEKANYVLQPIGDHAYVYGYRAPSSSNVLEHWICCECCNNEKKSILQFSRTDTQYVMRKGTYVTTFFEVWQCNACKSEVRVKSGPRPRRSDEG